MSVAKTIEIVSSSKVSIEDAVRQGVQRADESLDSIRGVWVKDIEAQVEGGEITEWRTRLHLTFVLKG